MEINYNSIKKQISTHADELFAREIEDKAVERFIEEVRRLTINSLDEAIRNHAADEAVLAMVRREDFEDFTTGYIGRMESWYSTHQSALLSEGASIDQSKQRKELEASIQNLEKRYYLEAAVGTVVVGVVAIAIPLLVSTSLLLLLGEAALLFAVYKRCQQATSTFRREEIHRQFVATKQALIDHTERSVISWLRDAEDESRRLDNEFKSI